jgi:hypothetical protein
MLGFNVAVQSAFVDWAALAVVVKSVPQANYGEIAQWMRRYAKVPMDFADATVLWAYRETYDTDAGPTWVQCLPIAPTW